MHYSFLVDVVAISGLALLVVFVCHRIKIPSIVGFLLTGVLAGPHGLGLVKSVAQVENFAEIGVICLLFTIGLEFSLKNLSRMKFQVLFGGGLQVLLAFLAGAGISAAVGIAVNKAVFFGFLISLSSTAIVLKIVQQRGEIETPHGRLIVGILIFQDLVIIPFMLITPALVGTAEGSPAPIWLFAKIALTIIILILAAKWIIPKSFFRIAGLRDRELFVIGLGFVILSISLLTSISGLSLALGAFIAGLMISESEYSHRALGSVLPFRDFFTSFFFVSIGMLFDLSVVLKSPVLIASLSAGLIIIKLSAAAAAAIILGFPARTAILTGLALCQIGEFSFVLSKTGIDVGLIHQESNQIFLGISVISMLCSPFLILGGEKIASFFLRFPMPMRLRSGMRKEPAALPGTDMKDHIIIAGFGLTGRNLYYAATNAGIPAVIVDMNPETVRSEQEKGTPIHYGDVSEEAVLKYLGVKCARVMVIVISDPTSVRRVIDSARRLNPKIHIIARTRFLSEMEPLHELGADEVIPEDYEVSLEVLNRVLSKYLIPQEQIADFIRAFRKDHYRMLQSMVRSTAFIPELQLADVEIASVTVGRNAEAEEKSLKELNIRNNFGVTILAIRRNSETIPNPAGDEKICRNDVLILLGRPELIADSFELFRSRSLSS